MRDKHANTTTCTCMSAMITERWANQWGPCVSWGVGPEI